VTRPPTSWERQRVQHALTLFAPWGSPCIAPDVFRSLALPLGLQDDALSQRDRKHALMHPNCAGLERLVDEWNRQCPAERLDAPHITLEVPMMTNNRPPAPEDCDDDGPRTLSERELRELRGQMAYGVQRAQRRHKAQAFHRLRVCVDGQQRRHFAPGARALPFTVPLSAICIQVFGQDAEGELPLAIFHLPDLEEVGDTQRLYAVLDGGATIALVLSPVYGQGGDVTAGRVAMQFWEDEAQVPKTAEWYAEAIRATARRVEVARGAGDQPLEAAFLARLGDLYQAQQQPDAEVIESTRPLAADSEGATGLHTHRFETEKGTFTIILRPSFPHGASVVCTVEVNRPEDHRHLEGQWICLRDGGKRRLVRGQIVAGKMSETFNKSLENVDLTSLTVQREPRGEVEAAR
jgi:hypothetical protein